MTDHEDKREEADEAQEDIELTEEKADDVKGGRPAFKYDSGMDAKSSDKV